MVSPRLIYLQDEYKKDREYSSQFDRQIAEIVGAIMVRPATETEDTKQATDAVVRSRSVAMRVRRPGFRGFGDVTIRSGRRSGAKTEFVKIFEEGWADLYFYGHATHTNEIDSWIVLDLDEVRRVYAINPQIVGAEKHNHDQETSFRPILVKRLPDACILAERDFREAPKKTAPVRPSMPPAHAVKPQPPQLSFFDLLSRGGR